MLFWVGDILEEMEGCKEEKCSDGGGGILLWEGKRMSESGGLGVGELFVVVVVVVVVVLVEVSVEDEDMIG